MKSLFKTNLIWVLSLLIISTSGCYYDDMDEEEKGYGCIYGMVTYDKTAEPVQGASVQIYTYDPYSYGDNDAQLITSILTYDDGHFEADKLKAGTYEYLVNHTDFYPYSGVLKARAKTTTKVDISLQKRKKQ